MALHFSADFTFQRGVVRATSVQQKQRERHSRGVELHKRHTELHSGRRLCTITPPPNHECQVRPHCSLYWASSFIELGQLKSKPATRRLRISKQDSAHIVASLEDGVEGAWDPADLPVLAQRRRTAVALRGDSEQSCQEAVDIEVESTSPAPEPAAARPSADWTQVYYCLCCRLTSAEAS